MKHLKKFNESNSHDEEELRDFCEGYLAYLLDDGDYEIFTYTYAEYFKILFLEKTHSYIEWDNIKDHFIPFLSMLDKNYNIENGELYEKAIDIDGTEYLISSLIDDKIFYKKLRFRFKYINIYIKK